MEEVKENITDKTPLVSGAVEMSSTDIIKPDFICVGNSDPAVHFKPCFIHFIYDTVEKAQAAAVKLFEQHQIGGYDDFANKTGPRPLKVHHRAGDANVPKSYSKQHLAFFRVTITDYQTKLRSAYGDVDGMPRRDDVDLHAGDPIFADSKKSGFCTIL